MSRSNDCWFWKNAYPRPLRQCRSRGMSSEKRIGKVQVPQFLGAVHFAPSPNQEVLNHRVSHNRDKECSSGCFLEIASSVLEMDIGSGFVLIPLSPDGNAECRSLRNQREQSPSLLCVSGIGQQANGNRCLHFGLVQVEEHLFVSSHQDDPQVPQSSGVIRRQSSSNDPMVVGSILIYDGSVQVEGFPQVFQSFFIPASWISS